MKPYKNDNTKTEQIKYMFDNIASTYDFLNHLLTFGIDQRWRRIVAKIVASCRPQSIIDIATGTGDLAVVLARQCSDTKIVALDLSPKMVEVAREKIASKGLSEQISFVVEDVEQMEFEDDGFDVATVAFGVRNFQDIDRGLRAMCRVVKPGGSLVVMEFSTPRNKLFATFYRFYFHKILPFVGGLFSKDRKAYRYLPESVDEFPEPEVFMQKMENCGFEAVRSKSLMFGAAYIYTGFKGTSKN